MQNIGSVIYSLFNKICLALLSFNYLFIIFIGGLLSSHLPPSSTGRTRPPTGSRSFHSSTRILKDPTQPDASIEKFSTRPKPRAQSKPCGEKKVYVFLQPLFHKKAIMAVIRHTGGCYIWTNLSNGKMYAGSSLDLASRISDHLTGRSTVLLQHAFEKYGHDNFQLILIIIPDAVKESVLTLEQYLIDTLRPAYNISPTAESAAGVVRSQVFKSKQRANNIGFGNPMYGRAGPDSPRFGILHTAEARVKIGSRYIYVYDASTHQLISSYLCLREAAKALHMSHHSIRKGHASGSPYKGMLFSHSSTI